MFVFIDADGVAGREGRINFTETKGREGKQRRRGGGRERRIIKKGRDRKRKSKRRRRKGAKGINVDQLMLDGRVLSRRRSNNGLQQRPPQSASIGPNYETSRRCDELSSVQQAHSFLDVVFGS